MPFVFDLHLFLGRPVQFAAAEHTKGRLLRMSALMLDTFGGDSSCRVLCCCHGSNPGPFPPFLLRLRRRVRSGPAEHFGWRKLSSRYGSRKLFGPSESAPGFWKCLQAVPQVAPEPLHRVHQTGQKHGPVLHGGPSTPRWAVDFQGNTWTEQQLIITRFQSRF